MSLRTDRLRDVLRYVRRARAALDAGSLPEAVRYVCLARGGLAFTLGLCCPASDVGSTARLRRVVFQLESDLETAVRPPPPVLPYDLIKDIADGILVLRKRDGVDITDEQAWERARNIAAALLGGYRISAMDLSTNHQQQHSPNDSASERSDAESGTNGSTR